MQIDGQKIRILREQTSAFAAAEWRAVIHVRVEIFYFTFM